METINRQYNASIDELQGILDESEELLMAHGATMKNIMNINIAVEEIFVNIASYAYPDGNKIGAVINITFDDENNVTYEFIDSGVPFDPLAKPDPDIAASIEERGIGGLGIYMVKKSMDECTYERKEEKNIFRFRKNYKV